MGQLKIDQARVSADIAKELVRICPFGAISDKSFILDVIGLLKNSTAEDGSKVYRIDPAGNCWSYRVVVLTKDNL